jgi:hypothetical protein
VADGLGQTSGLQRDTADEAFIRPRIDEARRQLGAGGFEMAVSAAPAGDCAAREALVQWLAQGPAATPGAAAS